MKPRRGQFSALSCSRSFCLPNVSPELPLHPPVKGRGLHRRAFGVSAPVPVVKVSKAVLLPAVVRAMAEAGICVQSHLLAFIPVGLVSSKREEIPQLSGTAHANPNSCPTTRAWQVTQTTPMGLPNGLLVLAPSGLAQEGGLLWQAPTHR